VENRTEKADNERDAKLTLRQLYKDFGKSPMLEPNGIKTGMHNLFWQHYTENQGLLQLV